MTEVLHVVCYYGQSCSFSCAGYKQVEILYWLTSIPQRDSFFGKSLNALFKRKNIHLLDEGVCLFQVLFYTITFVCSKK